ncbi:KH domain-containing protein At4g18375 [Typha angustifolia]|uniref:KH domain-containing protein At4g18375 n=1 Tax=Typha angustifolia TaxID=59011 RepID=UPI003C2F1E8D
MGETGKRSRQQRGDDHEGRNQNKRPVNKDSFGDGELVVYRILCPNGVIGSVIGKSGKVINSIRQETRAKIKVVDPYPGSDKRVITIYCYVKDKDHVYDHEDVTEPLCAAQDALLKVHDAIVNALANTSDSDMNNKEEANILVPASQAANIIGKSGATIKRLRMKTKANIKVNPKDSNEATHSCAMSFDNFVQITGDSEAVRRALLSVSAIMYKFSPKEEISLETSVPEVPTSIIIPSDVPIYPAGSFYHSADAIVPPPSSGLPLIGATPHIPEFPGFSDAASAWPVYPSALPVISGFSGPSQSEELVLRVLCPSDKIGRVIGKGGSTIKSVRQDSGARIDVDDTKDESEECVITVTSPESTFDVKSAAVEAVLLLQGKINDEDEERASIRLLVPSKVIGCLIGKGGSIINDMRKKTKADIRISKGEKPKRAGSSDELVEVSGEVGKLRDALAQIVLKLREGVLRDREGSQNVPKDGSQTIHSIDPLYSSKLSLPAMLPSIPPVAPLSYDQRAEAERGFGIYPGSSLYGHSSLQAGENGYRSVSSYTSKTYGGLPPYSEMMIPANALAKVMGKGGTNLENIRKISGAHIDIVDSKSSHFERIAQISGTTEQKQSAENLIKAFIMST